MNYCLRGRELLQDIQRSEFLPPWDEDGVRTVVNEIQDMYTKILSSDDNGSKVNNAYFGLSMIRNRKYLSRFYLCIIISSLVGLIIS